MIQCFDHQVLQLAHDEIAAWFRFTNPDLWTPLFPDDEFFASANRTAWLSFWPTEIKRLLQNDQIVVAILTAVAFQNEEQGYAAEKELKGLLRSEYDRMFSAAG